MSFTFDAERPAGERVLEVRLGNDGSGASLPNDETTYSLATTDFLALGGDGYLSLATEDGLWSEPLVDVVIGYLQTQAQVAAPPLGRAVTP